VTKNLPQIWEQVRSGDTLAWRRIVSLYAGLVYTVARRVGLDRADAEDCAQQTWLTLYQKRKTIKDPQALPAWLIRTTHRNAVTLARRVVAAVELADIGSPEDPALLPDDEIIRIERQAILAVALKKLDQRCRNLVSALFLSGQKISYKKLAASLGVNLNSFGALRSRCLVQLKKTLEKMGYEWH
jgi:RNA polymerase sigma factor (sigma-70 family)